MCSALLHGLPTTQNSTVFKETKDEKKWTVNSLFVLLCLVLLTPGTVLAHNDDEKHINRDMGNEYCPGCGAVTQFNRICYDGRQVVETSCTQHANCRIRKLFLGKLRTCQTIILHQYRSPGDHAASLTHSKSASSGVDYYCPYGAHFPILGW